MGKKEQRRKLKEQTKFLSLEQLLDEYNLNIGLKVVKKSKKNFKSGLSINTIKGIIIHPVLLNQPAYIFEEDDSYVSVFWCKTINI